MAKNALARLQLAEAQKNGSKQPAALKSQSVKKTATKVAKKKK